jgi:ferritin-like metal-binding protein YciE
VFEKFTTPEELFTYKLGSALKMEKTVVDMLDKLEDEATSDHLKQQLRHHAEETRQQIRNIAEAFAAIGEEPDEKLSLVIEAIDKEGRANIKRTADPLVDAVILGGAAETEHHEIAVYEWLIIHAEAMDLQDVAALLRQNLEQEQHTLEEVRRATQRVAAEIPQRVSRGT